MDTPCTLCRRRHKVHPTRTPMATIDVLVAWRVAEGNVYGRNLKRAA
jgi:hypothetical protein